jgi:hypothetical protein
MRERFFSFFPNSGVNWTTASVSGFIVVIFLHLVQGFSIQGLKVQGFRVHRQVMSADD